MTLDDPFAFRASALGSSPPPIRPARRKPPWSASRSPRIGAFVFDTSANSRKARNLAAAWLCLRRLGRGGHGSNRRRRALRAHCRSDRLGHAAVAIASARNPC